MDWSHHAQELPPKTLLKEGEKGWEDEEEEDISSYWVLIH
jgi:hypothetical protein